jgi:hypothetical protein
MATESEGSTSLTQNSATGHDPDPVPSTSNKINKTSKLTQAIIILTCLSEAPDSNLGRNKNYTQ